MSDRHARQVRLESFKYEGDVYVRPVSRGVVMLDTDRDLYVEDAVDDGYYRLSLSFEPLSPGDAQRAEDKMS